MQRLCFFLEKGSGSVSESWCVGFAVFCGYVHVSGHRFGFCTVSVRLYVCLWGCCVAGGSTILMCYWWGVGWGAGVKAHLQEQGGDWIIYPVRRESTLYGGGGGVYRIFHTPRIEKQREEERKKKEKIKEEWTLRCTPKENEAVRDGFTALM